MANIIEARVKQKKDTLENWEANPMILLDGEPAFVVSDSGQPVNFKIGDGNKRFSELPYWIQYDQAAFIPVSGIALPTPTQPVGYSILGEGTYTHASGDVVVPDGHWGVANWDGSAWSFSDMGELPAAPPVTKPVIQEYAFTKDEYVGQFFVDSVMAPTIRVNNVNLTDVMQKKEFLKKLDQCFKSFRTFGVEEDAPLALRQFTFFPDSNTVTIGISELSSYDEPEAAVAVFVSTVIEDPLKPFEIEMVRQYRQDNYFITMDLTPFAGTRIELNFRDSNQMFSYQNAGIRNSFITYLQKKEIWGISYNYQNAGSGTSWQRPLSKYFHDSVKAIKIEAKEKSLVKINGVSYFESGQFLIVVVQACADDDINNLSVTNVRNGFSSLQIRIPIADTGIKRYESIVLSGSDRVSVTMVVDVDYLFSKVPDISTNGFSTLKITDEAQYIVSPSTGGGGTVSTLAMIEGEDDFQGNFRFAPASNNWVISSAHNMSKLTRIPDETESIVFEMSLDGVQSNALWLDKDMNLISTVYDGSEGTVNTLTLSPPNDAVFVLAATVTPTSSAKITANGTFYTTTSVKSYRSIHEGLSDKYSGVYFEVNGFMFKKSIDGLCTVNEYSSMDGRGVELLPEYEKDGEFIIPTNVVHTNGVNTYTGGTLCAIKNGVMYFYNARYRAVFKSEDGGQTFTTIVDNYSHPGVWDTIDVDVESRSSIIALDNGELLFSVRHRGDVLIDPELSDRKERFYVLYRTTNGQTDLERCFAFSHEDTLRLWLPEDNPQRLYPNHSGGCLLGDFTHAIKDNLVVVTEYGAGTSKYWSELGVPNNARGISGRAWASFDYGVTWKKIFDADRKISGTEEADDNWFYFTSTYTRKMCHMHGVDIDPFRNVIHLTNGDNEDYVWSISIGDLETFWNSAPAVDPNDDHPVYSVSDVFPVWDSKLIVPSEGNSNYAYSSMRGQQMKFAPVPMGWVGGHDASREFAYLLHDRGGELIFEPTYQFELRRDYTTDQAFVNSWVATDGFIQGITIHNGVIYFAHSHTNGRPPRIWATIDGINWKIVYEGDSGDFTFAGKILFDGEKSYISYGTNGQTSVSSGYWKLKTK